MAWLAPYWRASVDANNAMSAIDGALWDIMGKRAGMPVHNLLGGKVRPALPMFANVNGRDLKELEENARARIAEGYKHLRVGAVGGDGRSGAGGPEARRWRGGAGVERPAGITGGQGNLPGGGGLGRQALASAARSIDRAVRVPVYEQPDQSLEHVRKTIGFGVDLSPKWTFA